jgi:hypothetical protein
MRPMDIVAMIATAVALITGLGVLTVLALLLVGIRHEERHVSLTRAPRTRASNLSRRLTGAHIRRPQPTPHWLDAQERPAGGVPAAQAGR